MLEYIKPVNISKSLSQAHSIFTGVQDHNIIGSLPQLLADAKDCSASNRVYDGVTGIQGSNIVHHGLDHLTPRRR